MNGHGGRVTPLDRMRGRYEGNGGGRSHAWPSAALHDVGPQMGRDGIDRRRLEALAAFIETLTMAGPTPAGRSRVPLKRVDGRTPCVRFHLTGGPQGFGFIDVQDGTWVDEYGLTGFGLCCWGWGEQQGMSAVATNGRVAAVHEVWTAEPVLERRVRMGPDIEPRHVADAIRAYCEVLDPVEAWKRTAAWAEAEPRDLPARLHQLSDARIDAWTEASRAKEPAPEPEPAPDPVADAHAAFVAAREARERAGQDEQQAQRAWLMARLQRGDDAHEAYRQVYGGLSS